MVMVPFGKSLILGTRLWGDFLSWEGCALLTANRPADNHHDIELVLYYKDSAKKIKHRENGPAVIAFNHDRSLLVEQWYEENRLHRIDGPASVMFFPDHDLVIREEWYQDGLLNRCGAPAVTICDHRGTILCQQWYRHGKLHRVDGPAWIDYQPERNSFKEMWYCQGELHRENGPAVRLIINGKTVKRSYYLEGVQKMTSDL
jgi:hypothetical protein